MQHRRFRHFCETSRGRSRHANREIKEGSRDGAAGLGTPYARARIIPVDPDRAHAASLAVFATNVRARADELSMSLSEVAEAAGIPRATLHAILSARRTPTLITLTKIGAAIGCSVVELLIDADMPVKKRKR